MTSLLTSSRFTMLRATTIATCSTFLKKTLSKSSPRPPEAACWTFAAWTSSNLPSTRSPKSSTTSTASATIPKTKTGTAIFASSRFLLSNGATQSTPAKAITPSILQETRRQRSNQNPANKPPPPTPPTTQTHTTHPLTTPTPLHH